MQADLATGARLDAPLGVFSYRVDVRAKGAVDWESLVRVRNTAALALAGQTSSRPGSSPTTACRCSRRASTRIRRLGSGCPLFSQWYGASLALPDERAAQLDPTGALRDPGRYSDGRIPAAEAEGWPLRAAAARGHRAQVRRRVRVPRAPRPTCPAAGRKSDAPLNDAPATSRIVLPALHRTQAAEGHAGRGSRGPEVAGTASSTATSSRSPAPGSAIRRCSSPELDTDEAWRSWSRTATSCTPASGQQTVKEPRAVSWFDPDVERMLVVVDLRTLALDTPRRAPATRPSSRFTRPSAISIPTPRHRSACELEYRDANVIDFADPATFGDLALSQDDIDAGGPLVLPTSRDIRITLLPVCSDKPGKPAYFGFAPTVHAGKLVRTGEPTQFFVRQDADEFDPQARQVASAARSGWSIPQERQRAGHLPAARSAEGDQPGHHRRRGSRAGGRAQSTLDAAACLAARRRSREG